MAENKKVPNIIGEFKGEHGWLSNFHFHELEFEGLNYRAAENAYQASKVDPADTATRMLFCNLKPADAKRLGNSIKRRKDWTPELGLAMMEKIATIKFQDKFLRDKLLATGDALLIEGNFWHDNFYGQCNCPKCKGVKGDNYLGKILMKVRSRLKK